VTKSAKAAKLLALEDTGLLCLYKTRVKRSSRKKPAVKIRFLVFGGKIPNKKKAAMGPPGH
jgi:hypothetical protein